MAESLPDKYLYISGAIAFVGLLIIILGFKFSEKTRKAVETTGAIIFHVGVFGILYYKVSLNLFISLIMLVFSLFILIDPLKIGAHVNERIYRLFGYIALLSAVAFSLDFFSGFPVWLWSIPLVIYLSPYLVSPLRKHLKLVLFVAWMVVFSYVGLIGYVIYSKFNPDIDTSIVKKFLPQLNIPGAARGKIYKEDDLYYDPKQEQVSQPTKTPVADAPTALPTDTTSPKPQQQDKPPIKDTAESTPAVLSDSTATQTAPSTSSTDPGVHVQQPTDTTTKKSTQDITGPYLKGLQDADAQYIALKRQYNELLNSMSKLRKENQNLKEQLNTQRRQQKANAPQHENHPESF